MSSERAQPIDARAGWSTVVIAATGPSFDEEQATFIANAPCRVIAINDNYKRLPRADVLYACDRKWWELHYESVRALGVTSELWTQDRESSILFDLKFVPSALKPGLTRERNLLHGGGNSGYQAINLAYLFGAKRLVLVGFDMQRTNDQAHWFGEHPKPLSRTHPYSTWIARFEQLATDLAEAGVDVVNCTKQTALQCFRRSEIASEFALELVDA